MKFTHRGTPAIAVLAVAGLVAGLGGTAHAVPSGPAATARSAGSKDVSVTLITGDKVVLPGGDLAKATIEPGAGRQHVGFTSYRTKDHSYVIPADVTKAVGDGKIDRRLFDVAELVKDKYDDASTSTIPVLTTYAGTAKRAVPAGTRVTRQLPSIGGAAMKVNKSDATTFMSSGGFTKLWLDGKRKVLLDQSVPQIGGPVAWQAGYTGKGVSVAVLDTGIDATHPDLATQVVGEKNFTTESADDLVGHGTHVASTIAGTGAASDGKYKGVAPDARIYDGKVCEVWGCEESAILAGMDWAANDVKAKIVNLSLGGTDTPDLDPLEEAVNRLTAQTGTLFVVAAGNEGPGDGTIDSPGSADAALTVGNVTKQDQLNLTSSRGPRTGDSALKPDVTAPGTDIVAAKSKDSTIGEPVGDKYLRLSGTSMATPHTAGAAAILLQEHPSWTPAELKAALMGSAKVAADQTSFQQGAGRIDLTTAIKQSVVSEPGNVSFGKASYPHTDDQPITREVTYRNLGDAAVTLSLSSVLNGPDGTAAPAGALKLSADSVTVPAGGTASVQATSDTSLGGADGLYSGRITATGGGQTVVVPVGVDKEVPTYTLTVKLIKPNGAPDPDYPVSVIGVDNDENDMVSPDENGTVTLRLTQGEYILNQFQEFERGTEDWIFFTLVAPSVKLTGDQTVVLDARKAKPVTTSVPKADAVQANSDIGFDRTIKGGQYTYSAGGFLSGTMFTYNAGPKLPTSEMTGHVMSQWGVPGADGLFTNTPYLYGIANFQPGDFPTGFDRLVKQSDLATVDSTVNKTVEPRVFKMLSAVGPTGGGGWARVIRLDLPRTIRYYVDQTPYGWSGSTEEDVDGSDLPFGKWRIEGAPVVYKAGRHYQERWNAAAFGPSVFAFAPTTRTADRMDIYLNSLTDADGHGGYIDTTSASTTLYRDGTEIGATDGFGISATGLPAGKASYKLVATRAQEVWPFATRIDLEATFTSSADQPNIPIHTVAFQPEVDGNNTMVRKPVTVLPFTAEGVTTVKVEYSGDGGATWKQAPVAGHKAIFPTPAGKAVSLRSTATDAAGNSTTQTVIIAYTMR
ncbi:subtilisin family serine protease [Kribbella rubisoli]|uniref:Subtilisin family serine protease n=1 Tax=Kribbella rubisoli TaxID=3075929 RepID=A0A4Q7WXW1_9ACTN|nr:S8 family peptidase [Kribbella rubisoli]RZU15441.1 subtilisin family serine protease [Kribbella rubisoli]